jgi:hypothetical protein
MPGLPIEMIAAIAPVGERPVGVDADGVYVGRCPQRIEMEVDVSAAILRVP